MVSYSHASNFAVRHRTQGSVRFQTPKSTKTVKAFPGEPDGFESGGQTVGGPYREVWCLSLTTGPWAVISLRLLNVQSSPL